MNRQESRKALQSQVKDLQGKVAAADRATQMDRNTVATLRQALAYAQSIVDTVREPMLVLDGTLHIRTASRASVNRGKFLGHRGGLNGETSAQAARVFLTTPRFPGTLDVSKTPALRRT